MVYKFLAKIYLVLEKANIKEKQKRYRQDFEINETARLGYVPDIVFQGNVVIGAHSYFNSGKIYSGVNSSVKIGEWCAIGYNVNIHAISHHPDYPTGPEDKRPLVEESISIGNNNWIGSNVFILPGVNIGSNCVIGANSVVNKDIPDNSIWGGIPAKFIRFKNES